MVCCMTASVVFLVRHLLDEVSANSTAGGLELSDNEAANQQLRHSNVSLSCSKTASAREQIASLIESVTSMLDQTSWWITLEIWYNYDTFSLNAVT